MTVTRTAAALAPPDYPLELEWVDLAAYRRGNTGIDHVYSFDSGMPGPHVMVNALTHGNEFCGMVAACHLLDSGVRPAIGTLTVSFANVAAYQTFDRERPFESRQIVHNLNRIWSAAQLDGDEHIVRHGLRPARDAERRVQGDVERLEIEATDGRAGGHRDEEVER